MERKSHIQPTMEVGMAMVQLHNDLCGLLNGLDREERREIAKVMIDILNVYDSDTSLPRKLSLKLYVCNLFVHDVLYKFKQLKRYGEGIEPDFKRRMIDVIISAVNQ